MVEKIYDTIKAILYSEFPTNIQGIPEVYDRAIQGWFFGDRKIIPSPLGVIFRGSSAPPKDIGFGLREIDYTIGITFYSSSDDQETSERVIQEASRIAHSILKNHRVMWICDLCPFCKKFPLSPIHYIDSGVIAGVGISNASLPIGSSSYTVIINGSGVGITAPAYIKLSPGISGNITVAEILSSGMGINTTFYSDTYAKLLFSLSPGSGHIGYSTIVLNGYANNVVSQVQSYWAETHSTSGPPYYDWAGVAYETVQQFMSDWKAGIQPASISSNLYWKNNLNYIASNNVDLMRLLQDIQVSEIKPSDDGMEAAFLHTAEFTLKGKEIISVDTFGPNNVSLTPR